MLEATTPMPWYVAGPLIGLVVPALLLLGGRSFGLSANLRHVCAAFPVPDRARPSFFRYDWRTTGAWNLAFALGIAVGGFLGLRVLSDPAAPLALAPDTVAALASLGVTDLTGLVPAQLISWSALATPVGAVLVLGGGFLVGFGARWAGGCTSGHAITGLADLQAPSLVAVAGFFAGGLLVDPRSPPAPPRMTTPPAPLWRHADAGWRRPSRRPRQRPCDPGASAPTPTQVASGLRRPASGVSLGGLLATACSAPRSASCSRRAR